MYTINHMWVTNIDGVIPEGRSKVYGLYKTMDEALTGLDKWFMGIPNNGCEITRVTETSFKFLSPDRKSRGYVEIQKIEER